jgi:hypothetical protein
MTSERTMSKLYMKNRGWGNEYIRIHNSPRFSGLGLISFSSSSTRRAWRLGRRRPIVPILRTVSSRGNQCVVGDVSVRPYLNSTAMEDKYEMGQTRFCEVMMGHVPLSELDLGVANLSKPRKDLLDKAIPQGSRTRSHKLQRANIVFRKRRME